MFAKIYSMRQLAALALILAALFLSVNLTRADCASGDEVACQNEINQQNAQLNSVKAQQADLQRQLDAAKRNLNSTAAQLADLQNKVAAISDQLTKVEGDLKNAQGSLDQNKGAFARRVRFYFMQSAVPSWLFLFSEPNALTDIAQAAGLRQAVLRRDYDKIVQYTGAVKNLDQTRAQIASAKATAENQLTEIQAIKAAQAAQVSQIQRNQSALSSQIDQINSSIKNLTSQQQAIIAAKLAATAQNSTVGSGAPATTTLPPAPFSPSFTVLTYGYPHRIGMNQYGAFGRAKAGQNYQAILQAYYGQQATAVSNIPTTINTDQGTKNFETDYMYGIAEMPTYWADQGGYESLKAQAVAARSYALNSIGWPLGSGTICTSQACQVYNSGKVTDPDAAKWRQAVADTRGQILTAGSGARAAFYSSTDGGYTCTDFSHVDPCANYLVDANGSWGGNTAYDGPSYGNSPWFHKAWGDRAGGSAYNPWLSAEETADIFNALTLSKYSSSYNQDLSPIDKGGWTMAQVRGELTKVGQPVVDAAAAVGYGFDGQGNTSAVSVVGANSVAYSVSGKEFRSMFNLRSRGTLVIWTSLYDVQKSP